MALSEKELSLLEKSIEMIDLQEGCPNQCITCGVDAPQLRSKMSFEDYMTLSDSIEQVLEVHGIELLGNKVYPFRASDPAYHPRIADVVQDLHDRHQQMVLLTTGGWTPGNNHMQDQMELLNNRHKNDVVSMTYSVKTVGNLAMADWDRWVLEQLGTLEPEVVLENNSLLQERLEDFFNSSRHVKRTASNLTTIRDLTQTHDLQFINPEDHSSAQFSPYSLLFSKTCVEAMYDWVVDHSDIGDASEKGFRNFRGIGRAISYLGMKPHLSVVGIQDYIEEGLDPSQPNQFGADYQELRFGTHTAINYNGTIQIFTADPSMLSSRILPKEFFTARAAYASRQGNNEEWEYWKTMEGLQGKNLLE